MLILLLKLVHDSRLKDYHMFTMQVRMAKSAKAVETFLEDLATKLKPLVDKELKELSRYKSEEVYVVVRGQIKVKKCAVSKILTG